MEMAYAEANIMSGSRGRRWGRRYRRSGGCGLGQEGSGGGGGLKRAWDWPCDTGREGRMRAGCWQP